MSKALLFPYHFDQRLRGVYQSLIFPFSPPRFLQTISLSKYLDNGLSTMTSKGTEVAAEGSEDLQVSSGECSTSFERFMFVKLP